MSKLRTAWFRSLAAGTLALSLGAFGCGDDDDGGTNPGDPDAAPGDPDASGEVDISVYCEDCPEGGEVRMEYVAFTNPQGMQPDTLSRTIAFFIKDMTPDHYPFPVIDTCYDFSTEERWPIAQADDRAYVDVGTLTITGETAQPFEVAKQEEEYRDFLFRTHPAGAAYYSQIANMTDQYTLPEEHYTVEFGGSDEFPATTFENAMYMPLITPTSQLDEDPFTLERDQELVVTWDTSETAVPDGWESALVIGFTGSEGPRILCLAQNDGEFTIPAEFVNAQLDRQPNGGLLARQLVTHRTLELDDGEEAGEIEGRRIDFLTTWCYVTNYANPVED
ncbi:MAG TPA: hypothetical protein VKZ63_21615 [Kofleriaceae bacterium]|nr:hypothetical protein [Kofleriaceae bacterium]